MSAIDKDMSGLRKRSIASVELQDGSGRRRTVQLDDLSSEDRALAEKFGYKPVRLSPRPHLSIHSFDTHALIPPFTPLTLISPGLQTRLWLPGHLFFCRLHLWALLHHCHNLSLSPPGRWLRLRRLVLAHLRRWVHVHCLLRRRARVRLPHLRRLVLHRFSSGASRLGPLHQLGCRLDQRLGSGRRRCFFGIWLRSDPLGCRTPFSLAFPTCQTLLTYVPPDCNG